MSFFKKIFGDNSSSKTESAEVEFSDKLNNGVTFGRYTDCNKNRTQLAGWSQSLKSFGDKQYVDSFAHFLTYLGDDGIGNLKFKKEENAVSFEFVQGSRKIIGQGNQEMFTAETNIAIMENDSIPVMRKLMNLNYGMRYSKFAMNDKTLCVKFSSHTIDASPNKLYSALKELAKKADQQDDLLLSEFSMLKEVDTEHIIPIDEKEREIKYNYLRKCMTDTLSEINKLDATKMAGGIAFLLLDLSYKIDYLICPQGQLTDKLERIQMIFFEKSQATTQDRNIRILALFDELLAEPKEKTMEGLYDVKCTFGIANAASHKQVMDMMFSERNKVAWYRDNGYPQIETSIYGYMLSYASFNYGMMYPVSDCLSIAMNILNPDYYKEMGDKNDYISNGELNGKAITKSIDKIIVGARIDYPYLKFNTGSLRFESAVNFIDSLIVELNKLDLRKK